MSTIDWIFAALVILWLRSFWLVKHIIREGDETRRLISDLRDSVGLANQHLCEIERSAIEADQQITAKVEEVDAHLARMDKAIGAILPADMRVSGWPRETMFRLTRWHHNYLANKETRSAEEEKQLATCKASLRSSDTGTLSSSVSP